MESSKKQKLKALLKLPNDFADWEFTSVLISRPIGAMLISLIDGFKWITPNLLTIAGFISFLTSLYLLVCFPSLTFLIAGLLLIRLVFDDMDGMLARYRGGGSNLGSYLDKITDVIGFFIYFNILGYIIYKQTHTIFPFLLANFATFSLLTTGYIKWVLNGMQKPESTSEVSESTPSAPPKKRPKWKIFLMLLLFRLPAINECDIFLISIILILTGKIHWLLYILAISQGLQVSFMLIKRGLQAHALDNC
jgi:phosphatidylglycerophosphate synthase